MPMKTLLNRLRHQIHQCLIVSRLMEASGRTHSVLPFRHAIKPATNRFSQLLVADEVVVHEEHFAAPPRAYRRSSSATICADVFMRTGVRAGSDVAEVAVERQPRENWSPSWHSAEIQQFPQGRGVSRKSATRRRNRSALDALRQILKKRRKRQFSLVQYEVSTVSNCSCSLLNNGPPATTGARPLRGPRSGARLALTTMR